MAPLEPAKIGIRQHFDEVVAAFHRAVDEGKEPNPQLWLACYPEIAAELAAWFKSRAKPETVVPSVKAAPAHAEAPPPNDKPQAEPTPNTRPQLGDYDLLEQIGDGGMGVVWTARQRSLNRVVALKTIRPGELASTDAALRFRSEAEAVASLDHPNIVPIYEVGEGHGLNYFSMKLIDGGSLSKRLDDPNAYCPLLPESQRWAARVVATVARAVHYAHQRGFLHRDLKPANILIDGKGEPHVADFGIAKRLLGAADGPVDSRAAERPTALQSTLHGVVLGTPCYMAPEQAAGVRRLTTAVDIYSLGAVLFQLLAGRPVFVGASPEEIMQQVRDKDPVHPSRFNGRADLDLEAICLHCLHKDPSRRYGSALALAEDLERWLAGMPVTVRPVSTPRRALLWARRQPMIAGLATAVVLVAVLGAVLVSWQWRKAIVARWDAEMAAQDADDEREKFKAQKTVAEQETLRAETERKFADAARENEATERKRAEKREFEARLAQQKADEQRRRAETLTYGIQIRLVQRELEQGDYGNFVRAADLLDQCDPELRSWEHRYLGTQVRGRLQRLMGHAEPVRSAAYSADGKKILSMSWNTSSEFSRKSNSLIVKSWDAATGVERTAADGFKEIVVSREPNTYALSRDGKLFAMVKWGSPTGAGSEVLLWDTSTGDSRVLVKSPRAARALAFSPDSSLLAAGFGANAGERGPGKAIVWNTADGQQIAEFQHSEPVIEVAFSPDSKTLASAAFGRTTGGAGVAFSSVAEAKIWDLAAKSEKTTLVGFSSDPCAIAFSPGGDSLATGHAGHDRNMLRFWDAATGKEKVAVKNPLEFDSIAWASDGKTLVTSGGTGFLANGNVTLWDVETLTLKSSFLRSKGSTGAVSFHPDGKSLLMADLKSVSLWNLSPSPARPILSGHKWQVSGLAISPDGSLLASASANSLGPRSGEVKIWEIATLKERSTIPDAEVFVAFSPDGKTLAASVSRTVSPAKAEFGRSRPGEVGLWDVDSGDCRVVLKGHQKPVWSAAFLPDGQTVVTSGGPGNILGGGTLSNVLPSPEAMIFWNVTTGEKREVIRGAGAFLAISPDGSFVASESGTPPKIGSNRIAGMPTPVSRTGEVKLWDTVTKLERAWMKEHTGIVRALAVSPNGKLLAVSWGATGVVNLWDVETAKKLVDVKGHMEVVHAVAFTPDSKRLATASADKTLKLWDTTTGIEIFTLTGFDGRLACLAFTRDGQKLFVGSSNKTISVFEAIVP